MKGRLGKKNAAVISATFVRRLRVLEWGVSCQSRISSKGATTMAICLVAIAKPRLAKLAFGGRYQRNAVRTRKKAQTLSVQPPAITTGNRPKGARLMLLNLAGANPKTIRIERRKKMKTVSRRSRMPRT